MDLVRRAVLVAVVPMLGAMAMTTLWGWIYGGWQAKWVVPVMLLQKSFAVPLYSLLLVVAVVSWLLGSRTRLAARESDADRRQLHGVIQLVMTMVLVLVLTTVSFGTLDGAGFVVMWYIFSGYPIWAFLAGFKWAPPVLSRSGGLAESVEPVDALG